MMTYRLLALSILFGAACSDTVDPPDMSPYADGGVAETTVSGYSWDPEAFWYGFATCGGQNCPYPPLQQIGNPTMERALVAGSQVALFDPAVDRPAYSATAVTDNKGGWQVNHVPSRADPPFLALGIPLTGAGLMNAGPPELPPIPKGNYFSTIQLKPIITLSTICINQPSSMASDVGVLQAVAKYLNAMGDPRSTAKDLVDPTKTGGIAVWWLWQPGPVILRLPAFGAVMSASVGQRLIIDWAPPSAPLPPEVKAIQSERGFFVNPTATVSPMGLYVFLYPAGTTPVMVQFTASDPTVDPDHHRPWQFPKLPPTIVIAPTLVASGDLPADEEGAPEPPFFACLGTGVK
jgi:hypothetical protein